MKTFLHIIAAPFVLTAFLLISFAEVVILGGDGGLGEEADE